MHKKNYSESHTTDALTKNENKMGLLFERALIVGLSRFATTSTVVL